MPAAPIQWREASQPLRARCRPAWKVWPTKVTDTKAISRMLSWMMRFALVVERSLRLKYFRRREFASESKAIES